MRHLSPGDSQTMDWYQRSACSLLGFHFLKRSGVKLFSLVAIDEETFNLDDEAKIQIEIPVGKGIPTSRIVKVGDLQRPVSFRPIPVSAGTRVGQPNEMRLLQRKRKRGPESALIQTGRVDRQTGNSASQAKTVSWAGTVRGKSIDPKPNSNFEFQKGSRETSSDHEHVPFDEGLRESGSKRALHQNPATCLGRDVNRANLATGLTLCLLLSLFGHKPMGLLGLARLNLNLGPRLPFLVGASRNLISIISFQSVKE